MNPSTGNQTLTLTGLRFNASLGILESERWSPSPSRLTPSRAWAASLCCRRDDEINHVLDYRKVRQIIIDECTAEHVNLLETLIGKLSPPPDAAARCVLGTRIKIAKLEIFADCEVAIRMETGHWGAAEQHQETCHERRMA